MRRAILVLSLLALGAIGFGAVEALQAIAHPVSCPGAFVGCQADGEEASYTAISFADVCAAIAGLLGLVLQARITGQVWRRAIVSVFIVTVVFLPFTLGLFATIYLTAVLPGYGAFAYLGLPLSASIVMVIFGVRWPIIPQITPNERGMREGMG